jgi:hypothetical protein
MKCATGVAFAAATFLAGAASAAALSGTFNVSAYNITNLNSVQSEASAARFDAAVAGTLGGADLVISSDDFTFIGSLYFETQVGSSTTIGSWLASNPDGGGAISGLDGTFGGLRQSKRRVGSSTATRTFYLFEPVAPLQASGFTIVHDDGISLSLLAGSARGPWPT